MSEQSDEPQVPQARPQARPQAEPEKHHGDPMLDIEGDAAAGGASEMDPKWADDAPGGGGAAKG